MYYRIHGYSDIIRKNLNIAENKNKCISFYKSDKDGKPIFRIGNNIILKNKIEDDNDTYLGYFRNKDKYYKYNCKLQILDTKSKQDLEIQQQLTKVVNNCPHFPILYDYVICKANDSNFKSLYDFINKYVYKFKENSDSFVKSNKMSVSNPKKELPDIVMQALENKQDLLITFKEYYDGSLEDFVIKNSKDMKLIMNAFIQINLALLFFYEETGKNNIKTKFHYKKINKFGCFHYKIFGKDYYVENLGYLWTIDNFGESEIIYNSKLVLFYHYIFPLPSFLKHFLKINFYDFYLKYNLNKNKKEIEAYDLVLYVNTKINIDNFLQTLINEFVKYNFLLTDKGYYELMNEKSPFVLFKDISKSLENKEYIPTRLEVLKLIKFKFDFIPTENNSCSKFYELFKSKLFLEKIINFSCVEVKSPATQMDAFAMIRNIYIKKISSYVSSFINKNIKFITTVIKKYNPNDLKDIKMKELLTEDVFKCHHFPILYDYKFCKKNSTSNSNSKSVSIFKGESNIDILITFSEIIDGNLYNICKNSANYKSDILINAFVQAFLALMFFQEKTRKGHYNYNFCNILYRKTNEGNYYHYKLFDEDYYLYNTGYIFIITDFTYSDRLPRKYIFNDFEELFNDIKKVKYHPKAIKEFKQIYEKFNVSFRNITSKYIMKTLIDEFVKREYLLPKNKIPTDAIVINKIPFVLNNVDY
jgi:hypothetical protein